MQAAPVKVTDDSRQADIVGLARGGPGLKGRLLGVLLVATGVVIGSGATVYLAAKVQSAPVASAEPATYSVDDGTLGRNLTLPGSASWPVEGVVRAPSSGIVTEISSGSGYLKAGTVLMRVAERPVVLITGDVPAFRDLAAGVRGRDVEALQQFLRGAGYQTDKDMLAYTAVTAEAVRDWHQDLGMSMSATVPLGDIVIVPSKWLASPLRWQPTVVAGLRVSAGDAILDVLGAAPEVVVEFGGSMPAQVATGDTVEARFSNGQTRTFALTDPVSGEGRTYSVLAPQGRLCAEDECLALVPVTGDSMVQAKFTLVPRTTGPVVPVSALQSDGGSRPFVRLADGTRREVTIVVVDGGLAIVDGVKVGDLVLLP